MKRWLGLFLGVVLVTSASWAQQLNSDDAPASKEDVERIFSTLHLGETMHKMMDMMMTQTRKTVQENLKNRFPDITQKDLDRIESITDTAIKGYDIDSIFDEIVPIYQRHLNKSDVAAMLSFYESPTGQKLLREQPAMMAESMQITQKRMEKIMNDIMDQVEKMAKEDNATPSATEKK